jgi:hypothetical protein
MNSLCRGNPLKQAYRLVAFLIASILASHCNVNETESLRTSEPREASANYAIYHFGRGLVNPNDALLSNNMQENVDALMERNDVQIAIIIEVFSRFLQRMPTEDELIVFQMRMRRNGSIHLPSLVSTVIMGYYDFAEMAERINAKEFDLPSMLYSFHFNMVELLMILPSDEYDIVSYIPKAIDEYTLVRLYGDAILEYERVYAEYTRRRFGAKESEIQLLEQQNGASYAYLTPTVSQTPVCVEGCLKEILNSSKIKSFIRFIVQAGSPFEGGLQLSAGKAGTTQDDKRAIVQAMNPGIPLFPSNGMPTTKEGKLDYLQRRDPLNPIAGGTTGSTAGPANGGTPGDTLVGTPSWSLPSGCAL